MLFGFAPATETKADTFEAEIGAQLEATVNATVGEWPDLSGYRMDIDISAENELTFEFDEPVKFNTNFIGIETDIPYTEATTAELLSIKLDGNEIAITPESLFLSNEGINGGLRLTLVNMWNDSCKATPVFNAAALPQFTTMTVSFKINYAEAAPAEPVEYVYPDSFNAFMMFSCPSGTWECYDPGKSGDCAILGDGVLEVYLKAEDIGATARLMLVRYS